MQQPDKTTVEASRSSCIPWKPILIITIVLALMGSAWVFDIGEKIEQLQGFIDGLGVYAPFVFLLIYIVATVASMPGTPLTLMAGILFGPLLGVILVSISSTIGAAICFLIARYFARDSLLKSLQGNKLFDQLNGMTETHGALVVMITRLVPAFPFNLLNYGFGLTGVPFLTYVFLSWICMLPATIVYVLGPAALSEALKEGTIPVPIIIVFIIALALMIIAVREARKILKSTRRDTEQPETATDSSETPS